MSDNPSKKLRTPERPWTAIMMLVAFAAVTSFNILYTNYTNRESDRTWCELMVGLDNRYQNLKTSDPEAIKFRDQIHRIRNKLRCPPSESTPLPSFRR